MRNWIPICSLAENHGIPTGFWRPPSTGASEIAGFSRVQAEDVIRWAEVSIDVGWVAWPSGI